MGSTLISTKLFVPQPAPGLVVRPRLLALLDEIQHNKLTLVSAQAGFGKTTMVVQWLNHRQPPLPTAWLSLETAENDPVRFWEYVITALQTISPEIGKEAWIYLHSSQPVSLESTLTSLVNDLVGFPGDFILVLDDYQFIQVDAVHQGLAFLLEHLPAGMHLIITTRVDPPLPLSHLRGKGALLEIRSGDLRFTREEAAALLAEMALPSLSVIDIGELNKRAEGWVVGLKMAALALRSHSDRSAFVSSFTGSQRFVMDYLIDEVLQLQQPEIIDFLLKTSILERMNASLCDAVTGASNGHQVLDIIEKANLFLIHLDTAGEFYRYHHLFRDLLQHRLQLGYTKEARQALHQLACQWYETQGFLEDAISQALSAQDWPGVIRLVRTTEVQVRWVTSVTMLNWLQQLPRDILYADHLILFNYVWCLFYAGQLPAVEDCLKYLDTKAEHDYPMQGRIANIRACIASMKGDWPQVEALSGQAITLLKPEDTAKRPWDYLSDYASSEFLAGIIRFQRGEFDAAEPFFEQAIQHTRECRMPAHIAKQVAYLGIIDTSRGRLQHARRLIEDAIAPFIDDPVVIMAHYALGALYYETNELPVSAHHYEQVIRLFHPVKVVPGYCSGKI